MDEGDDSDESDDGQETFIADSLMGIGQSNHGSTDILDTVNK